MRVKEMQVNLKKILFFPCLIATVSSSFAGRHLRWDEDGDDTKHPTYHKHHPTYHKHHTTYHKHSFKRHKQKKRKKLSYKTCTLKKVYIDAIRGGDKTVEGRLNKPFFQRLNVREGDQIWFYAQSEYGVLCSVKKVLQHASFSDMLERSGFQACVPEARTFQFALNAYRKFYSEKEEKKFGVLAWHIEPIGYEKPQN